MFHYLPSKDLGKYDAALIAKRAAGLITKFTVEP
jgi:hypothetical protein